MPSAAGVNGGARLDSWKAIAAYLGRDISTAMRWEKTSGLPVHRVPGGRGRSVFAYTAEIDAWLAGHPETADAGEPAHGGETPASSVPPPPTEAVRRGPRLWGWGLTLVGLAVLAAMARGVLAPADVARAGVEGAFIHAYDAQGGELWRHEVPGLVPEMVTGRTLRVHDLDGDRAREVALSGVVKRAGDEQEGVTLVLDRRGRVLWRQTLSDTFSFGADRFGPPWVTNDMVVHRAGGETRVAVSQHHFTWWPGLVSSWTARGELAGRFVNAGWIWEVQAGADGRHLLAAGVNNALGGAVLAVLDARNINGSSPPDGGSLPGCDDCPAGRPLAYFLVPWSDVAEATRSPVATVFVFSSGRAQLHAHQTPADGAPVAEAIVTVTPDFEVVERGVNDYFWVRHAQLEREGRLTHQADMCPWRMAPPVRRWLPQTGWQDVVSPPAPPSSSSTPRL